MTRTPPRYRAPHLAAAIALASFAWVAFAADAVPAAPAIPGATLEVDGLGPFVDDLMAAHFAAYDLVGASVAVVAGGEVVLARGYGFADLAAGVPVDADRTLFGTASVATPAAVLAAWERIAGGVGVYYGHVDPPTQLDPLGGGPRLSDLRGRRRHLTLEHLLTGEIDAFAHTIVLAGCSSMSMT